MDIIDEGLLESRDNLNTFLPKMVHNSLDVRGVVDSARCSSFSRSVDFDSAVISGRDYINFQRIKANALPCRFRLARGRQHERGCRDGCSKVWSLEAWPIQLAVLPLLVGSILIQPSTRGGIISTSRELERMLCHVAPGWHVVASMSEVTGAVVPRFSPQVGYGKRLRMCFETAL